MKKSLWFGALVVAALLVPQSGDAQNNEKLDKKVSNTKYLRNSVCMMMMTDKSVDEAKRPILEDAFFNAKWNNKYNNHNIANEDRVIDPDLLTITADDIAAFNMACQTTDEFLTLKNSGSAAPKQKYYNEAMTQITRSLMSEMAEQYSENGKTTIDTVIRLNVARMATKYLGEHNVAKKLLDKWFFSYGQYSDTLITERGLMNVSADELAVAKASQEAYDKLISEKVDFQELIGNTFVVVTRYCYKDKMGVIADRLLPLRIAASYESSGYGAMGLAIAEKAIKMSTPDGYYVTVDSYLFRLRWNPTIEKIFTDELFDQQTGEFKTEEFAASTDFALEFIGNERAWVRTKGKETRDMTDDELTYLAAQKAVNAVLAKFEAKYDQFKTKTPLIIREGEPDKKGNTQQIYTVALGSRDGLEGGEVFDVLELKMKGQDGAETTKYNKVGELVVDKKNIWNNDEEGLVDAVDDGTPKYTVLVPKDKKQTFEDKGYMLRMQNKKGKK